MDFIRKMISHNFTPNRGDQSKPTQLTFHTAVSGAPSLYPYFDKETTQSSTHGYIKLDGIAEQYVEWWHTAWANSNWGSNIRSLTFETQDNGNPNDPIRSDALYETCAQIAVWANKTYGIPLVLLTKAQALANQPGLTKHTYYVAKSCPAGLDINRIIQRALIIINQPMPPFNYELKLEGTNLYMHILSGSINADVVVKNLTKGTSFNVFCNKSVGKDGNPINIGTEKSLYEVNAGGVVKQLDNREIVVNPLEKPLQEALLKISSLEAQQGACKIKVDELSNDILVKDGIIQGYQEVVSDKDATIKQLRERKLTFWEWVQSYFSK